MLIYIIISILILAVLLTVYFAYKKSETILFCDNKRKTIKTFPDKLHLPFENVIFKNSEGTLLKGWFIPAEEESSKTIAFMHGWTMNKGDILHNTAFLRKKYNLFYFDFRGHGESGNGKISLGFLEVKDLACALKTLADTRPEQCKEIGLYGISMGAAVAIYEGARNSSVKCVVAESCYYSYEKALARRDRVRKGLHFPHRALALYFAKKRVGIDPEDFSPKTNIGKLDKPIFLINGADDTLSPRHDARTLLHEAKEPKQLWIVPNAGHTEAALVAGKQYQNRISEFFEKYL